MQERTFEAKVENLDQALAFVDECLEPLGASMKAQMQIDVAVEELFVNVASYAYAPGIGPITLRVEPEDGAVTITLVDRGTPYDPLAKADPDVTLSAEDRQIGGLGIFMVKKSMDAMEYRREDGCNILTIRKKLL